MKGMIFTDNAVYSFSLPFWAVWMIRPFVNRIVPYPQCLLTGYTFSQKP